MMKQKFILAVNPATGEQMDKIKCSSPGEVASAVKLAKKAYKTWGDLPYKNKAVLFKKIAKDFQKEKSVIAKIITNEMGKVYKDALAEVGEAIDSMERAIELGFKAYESNTLKEKNIVSEIHRIPIGVTAVITPWNFPVSTPEWLLTPAILAGNTTVFKPSECSPLSGKAVYELFNRHLPKGVINLIQGAEEVGEALTFADIDLVAFVGSQEVGKKIMHTSARKLIRLILELGGKDPMIVLKDADISKAASFAVKASLSNCGQICTSVERIYVDYSIADKFEKAVVEEVKKIKVGNGFKDVDMGPMVNDIQRKRVITQIDEAKRKGAKVLFGGNIIQGEGYFFEPTVITNLSDKHHLMQDETFGPIVAIQKVFSPDEALAKANDTSFGLGATVWTKNEKKAHEIARKLEAGMIGINKGVGGVTGSPWIGIKESGYSFLGSIEGMRNFTQIKKISYKS